MDNFYCTIQQVKDLEKQASDIAEENSVMKEDVTKLRRTEGDHLDRIEELEDLFLTKDKEFDELQLEVKCMPIITA